MRQSDVDIEKLGALLELPVPAQSFSLDNYKTLHAAFVELARGVESVAKVHPAPWEASAHPSRGSVAITDGTGAMVAVRDFPSQADRLANDFNRAVAVVEAAKPHLPWRPTPHE